MKPLSDLLHALFGLGVTLEASGEKLRIRGPASAIGPELRAELSVRKADILAHLRQQEAPKPVPLLPNQRRLWFIDTLGGGPTGFALQAALIVPGDFSPQVWQAALDALCRRHPVLNTCLREIDSVPNLQPREDPLALHIHDEPAPDSPDFDRLRPTHDALTRCDIWHQGPGETLVVLSVHHMISDQHSMRVITTDLLSALQGNTLAEADQGYLDVMAQGSGAADDAGLAYWTRTLAEAPSELTLPFDHPRPERRGQRGAVHRFSLPAEADLTALSHRCGATPFITYLAVYAQLLARWSGQQEAVIGCPMSGRHAPGSEGMVGYFVNTVALRLDLAKTDIATLIEHAKSVLISAMDHQEVPFDKVVSALSPQRHLNRNPLFQVMFVLQPQGGSAPEIAGQAVEVLPVPPLAPDVDLSLALEPGKDGLEAYLEYDPALFEPETIALFAAQFIALCTFYGGATPRPATLAQWNGNQCARPDGDIGALIAAHLADLPADHPILQDNEGVLSVRDLDRQAGAFAATLVQQGAGPGTQVGICLERTRDRVPAMLGVWWIGATVTFLPTSGPAQLRSDRISQAGLSHVICDDPQRLDLPQDVTALKIDRLASGPVPNRQAATGPAYLCFTSGTTGSAKPVAVGHASLINHALGIAEAFALTRDDKVLQFATPTFDMVFEDMLPALLAGSTLVVPRPEDLRALDQFNGMVARSGVSVANLPAPFWQAWVQDMAQNDSAVPAPLRLVITGSDLVQGETARQWRRHCPGVRLLSGYGLTETTITAMLCDPAQDPGDIPTGALPLGHPLPNVLVSIVGDDGALVPPLVVGQIAISGHAVADGYWNSAQTGRFRTAPEGRFFLTGDLGRMRRDGTLEFLGRQDRQIKIRGIRVDPGEVEAALGALEGVHEAAVIARANPAGQWTLVAYYQGAQDQAEACAKALRDRLPDAMVPQHFVALDALPRTESGKIDHPALERRPLTPPVAPRREATPQEARLAAIFSEVLHGANVGPQDNFFALGGDSISSLQIVARARRAGFDLTAAQVFEHQTVAALAAHLAPLATTAARPAARGPLPATPILAWFATQFDQPWRHFNQSVMLALPESPEPAALKTALAAITEAHEIFALRVDTEADQPYCIADTAQPPAFFTQSGPEDQEEAIARLQTGLDPAEGRNVAALWLQDANQLLLTIHHLCVDVLSWDVLLRDLQFAYEAALAGHAPAITPRGTPFRHWAERLKQLAATPEAAGALADLARSLSAPSEPLLGAAQADPGTDAHAVAIRCDLPAGVTSDLLRSVPVSYGLRMDETLIAALLLVHGQRGGTALRIDLERNGRASPLDDLDLADTVGWFTAVLPLHLAAGSDIASLGQQLRRATKESPLDGLGYGLARYGADKTRAQALAALPDAEILLNYVGVLTGWTEGPFRPVDADCGTTIAPETRRSHAVEVNAGVVAGCLRLELMVPEAARETATAVLDQISAALVDIARAARRDRFGMDLADDIEEVLPVTPLQQRILLHSLHKSDTYIDQIQFRLEGALDMAAMQGAWDQIIARHKALRTTFAFTGDDRPVQIVHSALNLPWRTLDWRALDAAEIAPLLQNLMAADRAEGLDLTTGPLMRMHMVRTDETTHHWIWSAHHLVLDGWSVSLVMQEWQTLYDALSAGRSVTLRPAADLAEHTSWLERQDAKGARDFWSRYLSGAEATLLAPPRANQPLQEAPSGAEQIPLSPGDMARITALAAEAGTTAGLIAQAAWALVLRRYGQSGPVLFGLTVSNRPAEMPGAEELVGMLINTVPVRVDLSPTESPRALLARMTATARTCAQWSSLAFDEILQASAFPDTALPFDSLILVQNYPRPEGLSAGDLRLHLSKVAERTDIPLTLVLQSGAEPSVLVIWDGDRIPAALAGQLLRHWHRVLQQITTTPDQPIRDVTLFAPAEHSARLAMAQGPTDAAPAIAGRMATRHWARILPHAPALIAEDAQLDYASLDAAVSGLAARLQAQGVTPGTAIALLLPRCARAIVAFLATLRAGGVAVPIDPGYPPERIAYMLADCDAGLVITDTVHAEIMQGASCKTLILDTLDGISGAEMDLPELSSSAPAYMIYTSGSTGVPKGTLTHHGGLNNMIAAQKQAFSLGAADRVLQFASLSFDASVWEIFMALGVGAQLFILSRDTALAGGELASYLETTRITAATLPPTVIAGMPQTRLADLKVFVAAGESCPADLARRWSARTRFFNAYGPSEASVCATLHLCTGDADEVAIGLPISGAAAYVSDADGQLVPPGGSGELVIGGAGVGLGYHARPELTARAFGPDPWSNDLGARVYRTGDMVAVGVDGTLVFRGRRDRQIKLRGFRIEPGEIEAALAKLPGVRQALVGLHHAEGTEPRLMAWILPDTTPDTEALRAHLATHFPSHMVPAHIVVIENIPLTPNGKIDWPALPAQAGTPPAPATAAMPDSLTPSQRITARLTTIWADLLEGRQVPPDQNFFDAGGHSLLLVRMQPMMLEAFGVQIRTRDLFDTPTIAGLAALILAAGPQLPDPEPTPAAPLPAPVTPSTASPSPQAIPIAVIGMACRYPGAPDLGAYWDMLQQGREGLSDLSRDSLLDAGAPPSQIDDPAYVRRRGTLAQTEAFVAAAFGISPRDAEVMDPQHRLFLECAWHALEDAGQPPCAGHTTGVFAGAGYNTWLNEVLRPAGEALSGAAGFHAITANEKDFLATQTAYRLDLRGPAVSVQTACSTSLVAIIQAVAALRNGSCDTALAGGVALSFPAHRGYLYEPDMILSPDGHCRPFSADAAGTVPAEGVGAVLLKPLDRALEDGDRIYAVIRGTGLGNDGARKVSFAAPGVEGQVEAMQAALKDAGLQGDDVDLLEAHGTGTALGDPVEMTAIARVYGTRTAPLVIGSVKGNIGHTDAAAGIAGFIKSALSLHHARLPASLHAEHLNPRLNLAGGKLSIATSTTALPALGRPARAAVSSFGIGGTNAHVVMEAAPVPEQTEIAPDTGQHLLAISGHTQAAALTLADAVATALETRDLSLGDVAATLQSGRTALGWRSAILAGDATSAVKALRTAQPREVEASDIAFLFSGQGSQYPGMGCALYDRFASYRAQMDDIDARLQPVLGLSIRDLIRGETAGAAARLRDTRFAQPAVFAVSVATARLWQDLGIMPAAVMGHSVGEFAAAHIAGVMDLDEALRLLVARAELIAAQPTGAMLAAALSEAEAAAFLSDDISLGALNGARQVVFSGPTPAVDALQRTLRAAGTATRRLNTSHAFHSAMMQPARVAFEQLVDRARLSPPALPFLSTVTGSWVTPDTLLDPGYWADHICRPVRFGAALDTLGAAGAFVGLDIGPGPAMAALAESGGMTCLTSHDPAGSDSGADALLTALGALWSRGAKVNWAALHGPQRRKVSLPLYPFARTRHSPAPKTPRAALPPKRADADSWFYAPDFQAIPTPATAPDGARLIATDSPEAALCLANDETHVLDLMTVSPGDLPTTGSALPTELLLILGGDHGDDSAVLQNALALIRAFAARHPRARAIRLITRNAVAVAGGGAPQPMLAALRGAIQVLVHEYPDLAVSGVDLDHWPEAPIELPAKGFLALRDGRYLAPGVRAIALPPQPDWPLPTAAKVLITGGYGGIGASIARALARDCPGIRLALTSRTDRSDAPLLNDLRGTGALVEALTIDVAAGAAAGPALAAQGPVDLVIHAAGCADYGGVLARRDAASLADVLAPKIAGLTALGPLLALSDRTRLVLCSTLGSFLPAAKFGQIAYSAANAYLDAAAAARRAQGLPSVAINWDDWVGTGMTEDSRKRAGAPPLTDDNGLSQAEGCAALRRILATDCAQIAVSVRDLPTLIDESLRRIALPQTPLGVSGPLCPPADLHDTLLTLFRAVLGDPGFGPEDSFFVRGGHSLLAMQLLAKIRDQTGMPCALADIFDAPSPTLLARRLLASLKSLERAE
jgi:amino acid adenylation domain-containing protein/non-ribosomal peptide synthase protein (TIGR01720 family)